MSSRSLPWKIQMHFEGFPLDRLIQIDAEGAGPNTMRDHFMAMLKESDYLRNGSIKKVMLMTKQDQTKLWDSLV
eukprot:jgi/Hompol1/5970/HPOL_000171-RA